VWAIIDDYENLIYVSSESIKEFITEKIPLISSDTKFPEYVKFGLDFIPNRCS
jgi:hypothetical protein